MTDRSTHTAVVDASALAAVLFGEPDAERVARELGERVLVAPSLLPYELASVAVKKIERYRSRRGAILEALALYPRLEVRQVDVPPEAAVETAEKKEITAYDAAYVWLARSLECELVTLDRDLAEAAGR